jgi:hypothetical protein
MRNVIRVGTAGVLAAMAIAVGHADGQTITGAPGVVSTSPIDRHDATSVRRGDMLLDAAGFQRVPLGASAFDFYVSTPWPGGIVPLTFDEDIAPNERARVFNACVVWAAGVSIRCVERTTEMPYVRVTRESPTCAAHVGRRNNGEPSLLILGLDWCWDPDSIQHEFGHTLGLIHEHQRSDRDTYVQFFPESLSDWTPEDIEANFGVIASSKDHTPYDFRSVMHYYETGGAFIPGHRVFQARPQFGIVPLGGDTVSSLDRRVVATVYGAGYRYASSGRPGPPAPFRVTTHEALSAMRAIDVFYRSSEGLSRPNGLSIGGRPDFLGLAAWFFDVYLSSRFAGYDEGDARYNVAAQITQTDEWRAKHPGEAGAVPLPGANVLPFDRSELLAVMEQLDRFYAAPEGLQRPDGLSIDGGPDFLGISAWVVEYYLGARLQGAGADAAWQVVVDAIRASDEWRAKH